MPTGPSLRELARTLGLSHTTVSEALRGCTRVHPKTRERVLAAANEAGYHYNPLAGALMSEMRRSRTGTFRGGLALVDFDGASSRLEAANRFHREIIDGATKRAADLGFKADLFAIGQQNISLKRLDTILQSRGIRGIFLLPVKHSPDLSAIDWSHYAGIYSDYIIQSPPLHTICSDHYRSMLMILRKLQTLGYKKPGLVLQESIDKRLLFRWEAGFLAYQTHYQFFKKAPFLVEEDVTEDHFQTWFKKHAPDVILCHNPVVMEWMERGGARIPDTHGFCCLNVSTSPIVSAGLDLRPQLIGSRGMELLIAQLHRNEYGAPEVPSNTTVVAEWLDGPTLKTHQGSEAATKKTSRKAKVAAVKE